MHHILQTTTIDAESTGNNLTHIDREASVLEASKLMRKSGSSELLVVDKSHGRQFTFGILTANDIVTRVIAAGLDPAVLTTGDITWSAKAAPNAGSPGHN